MDLHEGDLASLMKSRTEMPNRTEMTKMTDFDIAESVLYQMLQALDCLAAHNMVHRDVKPENILYTTTKTGSFHFVLGDFGLLCQASHEVGTRRKGTSIYMAPEIANQKMCTPKADIWSLFVTYLWTLNLRGFRMIARQLGADELHDTISRVPSCFPELSEFGGMVIIDPNYRASAAQNLMEMYGEKGLGKRCRASRVK